MQPFEYYAIKTVTGDDILTMVLTESLNKDIVVLIHPMKMIPTGLGNMDEDNNIVEAFGVVVDWCPFSEDIMIPLNKNHITTIAPLSREHKHHYQQFVKDKIMKQLLKNGIVGGEQESADYHDSTNSSKPQYPVPPKPHKQEKKVSSKKKLSKDNTKRRNPYPPGTMFNKN